MEISFLRRSIRSQITVLITLLILFLLGASSWLSFRQFQRVVETMALEDMTARAENNAAIVNNWLQAKGNQLFALADTTDMKGMIWEIQIPLLKRLAEHQPDFEMMYVIEDNGFAIFSVGGSGDLSDRDYFQEAMRTGEIVYSDLITNSVTGAKVVAVAQPVFQDWSDTPVGVICGTLRLDYFQNIVENMNLNGHGYGWIIDENMTTIAHPESEFIGNTDIFAKYAGLEDLARRMLGTSGITRITVDGVRKIVAWAPVEVTGWTVAMIADEAVVLAPIVQQQFYSLLLAVIGIAIGTVVAYYLARHLVRPIHQLRDAAAAVATGDLTATARLERQDEIGQLNQAFALMVQDLRKMVDAIRGSSQKIAAASEHLSTSTQDVGASIEEVAATSNEFVATVDTMSKKAQETAESAALISDMARGGEDQVRQVMVQMQELQNSMESIAAVIADLDRRSSQVGQIVHVITGIAEQTNLLALNAAIEAARVGENGRGFAVVADEVRKLAEQSSQAAAEVAVLIDGIRKDIAGAVSGMHTGAEQVENTAAVVKQSNELLHRILQSVEPVMQAIQEISNGIEGIASGSQQVAAATEEQSASVQELASAAQELSQMAQEMQTLIQHFKVEEKAEELEEPGGNVS